MVFPFLTIVLYPVAPLIASVSFTQSLDLEVLNKSLNRQYRDALDTALLEAVNYLQINSPKGASSPGESLAGNWDIVLSRKERNQLVAEGGIVNNSTNAFNRIAGRPPGKFPPYGEGTPLERWARIKGIPPFLLARKIAQEGTERFRTGKNVMGIDYATGDIKGNPEWLQIFDKTLEQELSKIRL